MLCAHRVGRTARAGRSGGALLFVSPEEIPYVELLRGRGVPLVEEPDLSFRDEVLAQKVIDRLRELSSQERELLEAGSTAFMSFLRAYKEHLCNFIFRLETLSIGAVARGFGLLRLPKIAETRGVRGRPIDFQASPVDTSLVPYRHKEKEQARLRKQKAFQQENEKDKEAQSAPAEASSVAAEEGSVTGHEGNKGKGKEKEKKKWLTPAEMEAQRQLEAEQKRKRKKKQSPQQLMQAEWDEYAAEEANFKKFKKGKISETDYEKCLLEDRVIVDPNSKVEEIVNGKDEDSDDSEGEGDVEVDDSDEETNAGESIVTRSQESISKPARKIGIRTSGKKDRMVRHRKAPLRSGGKKSRIIR